MGSERLIITSSTADDTFAGHNEMARTASVVQDVCHHTHALQRTCLCNITRTHAFDCLLLIYFNTLAYTTNTHTHIQGHRITTQASGDIIQLLS